jgi:hypothetical protein
MKFTVSVLIFLFSLSAIGQEVVVRNNGLVEFLYKTNAKIESITSQHNVNQLIPQSDPHLRVYNQIILKNSAGLYILIDGTGRVYKAKGLRGQDVVFQRIDSTHFYGYNGSAIIFSHSDSIFSFGGGGFWRMSGHLRYYSATIHEWNISTTNREVPAIDIFHCFNPDMRNLFYLQVPFRDYATGKEYTDYLMYSLDLKTRTNTMLGRLNKNLSNFTPPGKYYVNIPFLNGSLISFNAFTQYFISVQENKVYKVVNDQIQNAFYGKSDQTFPKNIFAIGDTIFYTSSTDSSYRLQSFRISTKDFVEEPYPLYEPVEDYMGSKYILGGSIILLLATGLFFYLKPKMTSHATAEAPDNTFIAPDEDELKFNSIELALIQQLLNASKLNKQFSVEDINTALGLGRKSLEVQKKGRTETINRINHKFKVLCKSSSDLIERVRLKEDKRFYHYVINNENAQKMRDKM